MATKTFYATGGLKYGTRRLQAGDPIELTDPLARLYLALGKVTDKKPPAFAYIDDRAICFQGDFAKTLDQLEAFKAHWESD